MRVVITGAGSGIGRATAIALAARNCELVLVGRREDALAETARLAGGGQCVAADVSLDSDRRRILAAACDKWEGALGLVNAAGVATFGDFASMNPEAVEEQVVTNLVGPMLLTQLLVPRMLGSGQGVIVNVLSIAADRTLSGSAAYSASKAGLRMFGKVLAEEVRRQGVRVTSILPGAVDTPIWDGVTGGPDRADMLSSQTVALTIAEVVCAPSDRAFDEIILMPPKGIL